MHVREISDSRAWNQFVLSLNPNTFLQSWEWGQVQQRTGEKVRYLGIFDGEVQIGAALIITVNARRGRFLLIPHGPLIDPRVLPRDVLITIVSFCRSIALQDNAVALRIAPLLETTPEHQKLFSDLGFRPAPIHIHAELTWVLDISKSEEALLAGMRKTTRHAVKKAQKEGVRVEIISNPSGLNRFWPLYEATKNRHGFVPFSKTFLQAQADVGGYFAIARHGNQDVAGAFLVHFGNTVFYYHGASLKLSSAIPAAQLLQWESIREAKRRGAFQYNFWGIARDDEPNHPFAGITVFKKGFGGYAIDYLHAQDLPLSLGYWKLWLVDSLRKWWRGF